jgi:GNAT superfamily N-acetyltransferase
MSAFTLADNVGTYSNSTRKGPGISPAKIHVRPAQPADAEALKAILYDTFDSTWRPQITPAAAAAFRDEDRPSAFVGEKGLAFLVAERDGEVAGFVFWEEDFVHSLHVHSRHARHGVGARLMDHAEAAIRHAGHASVRLETDTFNQRSQAFYAARGFVEAGRYPDEEWNSGLTTLPLVKPLVSRDS